MLALAGLAWHTSFPINKNLWSPSYVLFTAGLGALWPVWALFAIALARR